VFLRFCDPTASVSYYNVAVFASGKLLASHLPTVIVSSIKSKRHLVATIQYSVNFSIYCQHVLTIEIID